MIKKVVSNEVVFLGLEDELLGQKLTLIIEGEKSTETIQQLAKIIYPSKNHQPKEIIFFEKFPRIPNGKIDRRELIQMISNR